MATQVGLTQRICPVGPLVRKGESLGMKPKPDLTSRAPFGVLFKHGPDRVGDSLVGMKNNFTLYIAPQKPTGKPRPNSPRFGLVANGSIEAHAQHSSASAIPLRPSRSRSLDH